MDMAGESERLIEAGNVLAQSLGHHPTCLMVSRAIPSCSCAANQEQAKALDDWQHLVRELEAEKWSG
jgi:hypothetical protein